VHKLSTILGIRFNDAMVKLTKYEECRGPYSPLEAPNFCEANIEPHQWWHRIGGRTLPKIAKRILLFIMQEELEHVLICIHQESQPP
jgi:hypothetical protein